MKLMKITEINECGIIGNILNKNERTHSKDIIKEKRKIYNNRYNEKHKKEILQRHRKYYKDNKKDILKKEKKYYKNNKNLIKNRVKEYYKNHRNERLKYSRDYIIKNRDKIKIQRKMFYIQNKKDILEKKKIYYQNHKEKILEKVKIYSKNNKNKLKVKNKQWRIKNRDILFKKRKDYYFKNRNQIISKAIEYEKNRIKTDINYKLRKRLKCRFKMALDKNYRSGMAIGLLGCTIPEVKNYIEKQFKNGMTWKNYGKWHIDHVKPCASFNLTKAEDQRKCFHYTNLQPLWAKDNIVKGNRYR